MNGGARPLAEAALLLLLYGMCVLLVVVIARWMARPMPAVVLVACALLPLCFFTPGLFTGGTPIPLGQFRAPPWGPKPYYGHYNPYLDDVVTQFLPWMDAVRSAWKEGEMPFRNRWNGSGTPLAANGSSSAFSPWTFLAWPLSLPAAFLLIAAIKLLLAMSGTWLWLKSLRLSDAGALFGSVAFGFSFSMTAWVFFPHTAVIALWPWTLFAIEKLADADEGRRAAVLLTATFTLWPLSGHIESAALGAGFAGSWLLARLLARDLPEPRRVLGRIAMAAGLALGLSAFYLVPHARAIAASNRRALLAVLPWEALTRWTPHPPGWMQGLWQPLFPRSLGDGLASPVLSGPAAGSFPEMALGFFGITAAAGALLSWRRGKRPRTEWTLWVPLLAGLGVATFAWPFLEVAELVPGLRLIFPLRFFSWVALAGAAIAAFEVDRLQRDLQQGARGARIAVAVTAAALAFLAVIAFLRFRAEHAAIGGARSQATALAATIGALTAFALLALTLGPRARRTSLAAALTLLSAVELFYQGRRLYRFSEAVALPPTSRLLMVLRSQPGVFRVTGDGYVLYPNTNVLARLEEVRTHDPVEPRAYVEWLNRLAGYPPAAYFKYLGDPNSPALDRLNVRYFVGRPFRDAPGAKWRKVYAGPEGTLFENTLALERVFLAAADGPRHADVRRYRERTNSVAFDVTAPSGGVRLDTSFFDDGGWSAASSAGPIRIERDDVFLRLALPPGEQTVRLRYLPPGWREGAAVSLATVLVVSAWWSWRARRRRTSRAV